jgi:hypothetical protein
MTKRELERIKKMNEKIWDLPPSDKQLRDKIRGKAGPRYN